MQTIKQKIPFFSLLFLIFSIQAGKTEVEVSTSYPNLKGVAALLTNYAETAENLRDSLVAVFNKMSPLPINVPNYRDAVELLVNKKILEQGNLSQGQIEDKRKGIEDKLFELAASKDADFDTDSKAPVQELLKLVKIAQLSNLNSQKSSGQSITISFKKEQFIANTKIKIQNRCIGAINAGQLSKEQFEACKSNAEKALAPYTQAEDDIYAAFRENGNYLVKPSSALELAVTVLIKSNEQKKEVLLDADNLISKRISELIPLWLSDKEAIDAGLNLAKWLLVGLNSVETEQSVKIFGTGNINEQLRKATSFFTKICQQILEMAAAQGKVDDAFSIALIYFKYHFSQYTYAKAAYIDFYNRDSKNTFHFVNPTEYVPGDITQLFGKFLEKYNVVSILINVDSASQITDNDKKDVIRSFEFITDMSADERNALQVLQKYVGQKGIVNFSADTLVFDFLQVKYFQFMISTESKNLDDTNIYSKFDEYLKYNYFTGSDDEKSIQLVLRTANYLKSKKTVNPVEISGLGDELLDSLKKQMSSPMFLDSYNYFAVYIYNDAVNKKNALIGDYNKADNKARKLLEAKINALDAKITIAEKLASEEPSLENLKIVMDKYVDSFASDDKLPEPENLII